MQQKYGDATVQYQLAELTGARFVGMAETKRDVKLEESVVKQITGNDTISARAPYGKPFSYRPQFKLWMSTNHKPEIPDGSEAIWDRMKLIPFTQRFEGKGADTNLPEKLREELPGVLAWAVMGCVEWYQHGLGTAAAVEAATAAYREETDVIDRFFADVCVFGPQQKVGKKELYEAWEAWCYENGEEPGKQNGFTRVMGERGVVRNFGEGIVMGRRIWKGIGVDKSAPNPSPENKSAPIQKSCKQGGSSTHQVHFSSDSGNFSTDPPRVEGFSEKGKKVHLDGKSAPKVITAPLVWTVDGLEISYEREGE